jgi:hypothetical protein
MSEQPQSNRESHEPKGEVHVFGGGVAGLTAAHELALRGFKVHLYERESTPALLGFLEQPAVGGLARTQYFFIEPGKKIYYSSVAPTLSTEGFLAAVDRREPWELESPETLGQPSIWFHFDSNVSTKAHFTPNSKKILDQFITKLMENQDKLKQFKHSLSIYVQAFSDGNAARSTLSMSRGDKRARALAKKVEKELRAGLCCTWLVSRVKRYLPNDDIPLAIEHFGQPPDARDWVRVILYNPMLPGEHGYRLFPSYYRHVFDTMERIPRYDEAGQPRGGTVLDNLVSLPYIGMMGEGHRPFIINWQPPAPGQWLASALQGPERVASLGMTSQDLMQFSLRVLRFMLTCPERRAAELQDTSWWEYLQGYHPRTGTRLYRYSESFEALVKSSGRVLVALDAEWAEAHTCGITYAQLLSQALVPTPRNYCTLNAPTSEAWFFHWRKHLERLGVKFHHARLKELKLKRSGYLGREWLVAEVEFLDGRKCCHRRIGRWQHPRPCYFVLAADLVSANQVTKGLPRVGVLEKLEEFTCTAPPKPRAHEAPVRRDPQKETGRFLWDRLQTLSGVQFFYKHQLNIFDGYTYCTGEPWGLSAISSQIVWEHRPILRLNDFQSLLSVDVGDWKKRSLKTYKSAWDSSPEELAGEVWRQFLRSLRGHKPHEAPIPVDPPEADWIHIDEFLEYGEGGRLVRNKAPFLIPVAGDWGRRPGPEPWDPTPGAPPSPPTEQSPEVWQAPHGGYPVHWDRLVFAGTWLKTFTRLTTMESANESGRHAVNAIIDHALCARQRESPNVHTLKLVLKNQQGYYPTTPLGDYCRIWNPEMNELPDIQVLREADAYSFSNGLPHPWDLLGVEYLPSLLSQLNPGQPYPMGPEVLLQGLGAAGAPGGTGNLLELLRRIRQVLESAMPPGGAAPGSGPPR